MKLLKTLKVSSSFIHPSLSWLHSLSFLFSLVLSSLVLTSDPHPSSRSSHRLPLQTPDSNSDAATLSGLPADVCVKQQTERVSIQGLEKSNSNDGRSIRRPPRS
jgi:hypothetical protein